MQVYKTLPARRMWDVIMSPRTTLQSWIHPDRCVNEMNNNCGARTSVHNRAASSRCRLWIVLVGFRKPDALREASLQ